MRPLGFIFLGALLLAAVSACGGDTGGGDAAPPPAAIGYVKASNTRAFDGFGESVALSADGNTLAVGAPGEDSAATGVGGDQLNDLFATAGAVYVFIRAGAAWSQQAYLKASNSRADDIFGFSVALGADGNTLAVGAAGED